MERPNSEPMKLILYRCKDCDLLDADNPAK
jgi:hypothetical protein